MLTGSRRYPVRRKPKPEPAPEPLTVQAIKGDPGSPGPQGPAGPAGESPSVDEVAEAVLARIPAPVVTTAGLSPAEVDALITAKVESMRVTAIHPTKDREGRITGAVYEYGNGDVRTVHVEENQP